MTTQKKAKKSKKENKKWYEKATREKLEAYVRLNEFLKESQCYIATHWRGEIEEYTLKILHTANRKQRVIAWIRLLKLVLF